MYNELQLRTNSGDLKIFIQDGFYPGVSPSFNLHAHSFTELHIVTCDNFVLKVGNETYNLNPGDMAVIPGEIYHSCVSEDCCFQHTAFQIDCDVQEFGIFNIGRDMAENFLNEIFKIETSGEYRTFAAYVSFLTSYFNNNYRLKASPVTNQRFLIREFFSLRYREDIHLSDLAEVLHVSERHAERLVIDNMGTTFKEQLVHARLRTAENLLHSTDMTLGEIALYVGYKSYAGFWKAMQKYSAEHYSLTVKSP